MEKQAAEWAILMPAVCDAYLCHRFGSEDMMEMDVDNGYEEIRVSQVDLHGA